MTYKIIGPVDKDTCDACSQSIGRDFQTSVLALIELDRLSKLHLEDESHLFEDEGVGPCRCYIKPNPDHLHPKQKEFLEKLKNETGRLQVAVADIREPWGEATPESYEEDIKALSKIESDFSPMPVDGQLKRALTVLGCMDEGHMDQSDFWGPEFSYRDIYILHFLGQLGKRGAEAGRELREKVIDAVKNNPEDMVKYWTTPLEGFIGDTHDYNMDGFFFKCTCKENGCKPPCHGSFDETGCGCKACNASYNDDLSMDCD